MSRLPDFILIGAARSGTTSVHEYLRQHPNISLPTRKETHFFVCDRASTPAPKEYMGRILENYIDQLDQYLDEFDQKAEARVYGEVCPSYLYYPNAAINIKKYIPGAKILCILRNPVDRFYSNFSYRRNKTDSKSLDETIASLISNNCDIHFARLFHVGLYFQHLSRYFSEFPRQNIKIFLFEDLQRQPGKMMDEFLNFIDLPAYRFSVDMKFNASGNLRSKWVYRQLRGSRFSIYARRVLPVPAYQKIRFLVENSIFKLPDPINPKSRKALQKLYRDDILNLQALIQLDLSTWLQ